MALSVDEANFNFRLVVPERYSGIGFGAKVLPFDHVFEHYARYANGTGANKVGAVYSRNGDVVNGTPLDLDLRGTLTSIVDGSVVNFPLVMGIVIRNNSTTAGQSLTIGAGSNPFISWLAATGDGVKIGPSGFKVLWNPIDAYATSAGTADILRIVSDVGTVNVDVMLIGRAS